MLNSTRLIPVLVLLASRILPLQAQQSELRSLANGLAEDIVASGKKSIAVVDFTDLQGRPTELGRFLAEEFAVALTRTHKGFEIIDRAHLKTILAEHKLAATGLIDPATAKKLGQIIGADALLSGSMTPFSESVRIAVKVITTDTGRIIAADTSDLPKTSTITELLGASRTAAEGPVSSSPPPSSLPSAVASQPSSPVVVEGEFQYELRECRGTANAVKCNFQITNRGPDRNLTHYCGRGFSTESNTRAFDNSGNESAAESCVIGNRESGYNVTATLISGVPVLASVLFPHLSSSATSASLITIMGGASEIRGRFINIKVSFRDVAIVR
jgi:TolB-like protein